MLTFPEVLATSDVVVFPDDEDCNLYYLVPNVPRLRLDNGTPVFRGLFWTDQADGQAGSVAGLRGALLNFDVDLEVGDNAREEVRHALVDSGVQQQRHAIQLREEQERLDRQARATGAPAGAPRVPDIGPIRFGDVEYSGGEVVLLEEKSGGFVEWSSAGGPPSLIGSNNAAFALRLGAEGAAVWYRGLERDATAIGVRYELKFQARLPSLDIRVWAGSHEKTDIDRKAERVVQNMDQGCSDADVEHIDVKEVSEHLIEEGLINIEITKGSAKVSDENVAQLREMAISLITDRVKQVIASRIHGMSEEERRSSLLGKVTEEITSFAELRLTQRDVVEWGINPQATITDFLHGMDGDARKHLVTLVDLADPVVATLEVPVSVSAPWAADPPVTRVSVEVTYPAAPEDSRTKGMDFAKDTPAGTLHWRRERNAPGAVQYTARAYLLGVADPIVVAGGTTNGPVHIEVPEIGTLAFKARPYLPDFSLRGAGKVTGVQLDYEYKTSGEPDHVAGSVVLRPEETDGRLVKHRLTRAIDAPVRVRTTYLREDDAAIARPEVFAWVRPGEEYSLDVPSAWPDKLKVGAAVRPGIPGLTQVDVELRHDDTSGFASDARMTLDADGDWQAATTLVQADRANQRFRYRYLVHGADQLAASPWVDAEGDGDLPLLPVMAVRVRADRLGLGTDFTDAVLRLHYVDSDHGVDQVDEFELTDPTAERIWLVPRVNPTLDSYRYSLTLFPAQGGHRDVPEADGHGEFLVLDRPALDPA